MTENKRYSFNWKSGHPNFWDNHCDLADCYLTCGDVVNILNELNDENEQLKKENYELHKRLGDFEPFEEHMKERTSKTSVNYIVGLVKTDESTDIVELKRD